MSGSRLSKPKKHGVGRISETILSNVLVVLYRITFDR